MMTGFDAAGATESVVISAQRLPWWRQDEYGRYERAYVPARYELQPAGEWHHRDPAYRRVELGYPHRSALDAEHEAREWACRLAVPYLAERPDVAAENAAVERAAMARLAEAYGPECDFEVGVQTYAHCVTFVRVFWPDTPGYPIPVSDWLTLQADRWYERLGPHYESLEDALAAAEAR